jgi:pimeloyl-ACP methyl ester carboxylesterase
MRSSGPLTHSARKAAAGAVAALSLVLAGCAGVAPPAAPPEAAAGAVRADDIGEANPDYADFYSQKIEWGQCELVGEDCGSVEVPMDWGDPKGPTIRIAVNRIAATSSGKRIGSLLVNPGGPGASGVDYLDSLASSLPAAVREAYDIIGFDPRGVGSSSPVRCYDSGQMNQYLDWWPEKMDTAGIIDYREQTQAFAQACLQRTGQMLGHVDSVSVARDMDVIRAVLGDKTLNYVGFSYGTLLGALYAENYPQQVGRLILDGAIDPSEDSATSTLAQIASFEKSLRAYIASCQEGTGCPLTGGVEGGLKTIHDLIAAQAANPLTTDYGRDLSVQTALMGVLMCLYDDQLWTELTAALDTALTKKDGTALMQLADYYFDRDSQSGAFQSNMFEAFAAIGCLDDPVDARRAAMDTMAGRLKEAAPTLGEFSSYGEVSCAEWPYAATGGPHKVTAKGAAPIIVVGTTGDPSTPYESAVSLADQLESGVLLTYEGEGHTAIGRSNECVEKAVADFLVGGTAPKAGTKC